MYVMLTFYMEIAKNFELIFDTKSRVPRYKEVHLDHCVICNYLMVSLMQTPRPCNCWVCTNTK